MENSLSPGGRAGGQHRRAHLALDRARSGGRAPELHGVRDRVPALDTVHAWEE